MNLGGLHIACSRLVFFVLLKDLESGRGFKRSSSKCLARIEARVTFFRIFSSIHQTKALQISGNLQQRGFKVLSLSTSPLHLLLDGLGAELELETGVVGPVFKEHAGRTEPLRTVLQEPKLEPRLSVKAALKYRETKKNLL